MPSCSVSTSRRNVPSKNSKTAVVTWNLSWTSPSSGAPHGARVLHRTDSCWRSTGDRWPAKRNGGAGSLGISCVRGYRSTGRACCWPIGHRGWARWRHCRPAVWSARYGPTWRPPAPSTSASSVLHNLATNRRRPLLISRSLQGNVWCIVTGMQSYGLQS